MHAIRELEASREQFRKLSEEFREASVIDELTGIANRRSFNQVLEKEWKRAIRERTELSLMLVDLDGFKEYNDHYGHLAGDRVLICLARELSKQFRRPADLFARFGGDEFAANLPRTDQAGARTVAQNCQRHLDQIGDWFDESSLDRRITISIGTATEYPEINGAPNSLVQRADRVLYQAKRNGAGLVVSSGLEDP